MWKRVGFVLGLSAAVAIAFALGFGKSESRPVKSALRAAATQTAEPTTGPVMGHLETKDHRITIFGGGLYTVATKGGKILAERVTLQQLQKSDHRLFTVLERAMATATAATEGRNFGPPLQPGSIREIPIDNTVLR